VDNVSKSHEIVVIDNYDSFTFNLVQYLQILNCKVQIFRNDELTVADVLNLRPHGIVLSPGPSTPDKAGICLDLVPAAGEANIPLLGVCLGHQTIGQAFGAKVIRASLPMHGKVSQILHQSTGIFRGLPHPISATRYHSLIIERSSLPAELMVTAETKDAVIMGVRHRSKFIEGVQFHPESILTEHGLAMLKNFVDEIG
jgi:anthranilate synthase component 2